MKLANEVNQYNRAGGRGLKILYIMRPKGRPDPQDIQKDTVEDSVKTNTKGVRLRTL